MASMSFPSVRVVLTLDPYQMVAPGLTSGNIREDAIGARERMMELIEVNKLYMKKKNCEQSKWLPFYYTHLCAEDTACQPGKDDQCRLK